MIWKPQTNSTTALQIQSAAGIPILTVNSTDAKIGIGTTSPAEILTINGNIGLSGASRSISVLANLVGNGNGLSISSGMGDGNGGNLTLSSAAGFGSYASDGGNIAITSGSGNQEGVSGSITIHGNQTNAATIKIDSVSSISLVGGNVLLYGGDGSFGDGNVILAHNGSSTIGKVGIGTASPGQKLDVAGTLAVTGAYTGNSAVNGIQMSFTSNEGNIFSIQESVSWRKLSINSSPLLLNSVSGGSVGIGTSSPNTLLHVAGAITVTGGIRPATDSTTALQLQNAAGSSVLTVDTTNSVVSAAGAVKTNSGGAAGVGAQDLASYLYVQSRGMNLVANGLGQLGNNYNFPSSTYDQVQNYAGQGSFKYNQPTSYFTTEAMPVLGDRYYKLDVWAKSTTFVSGNVAYIGVAYYDIEGLEVSTYYFMRYSGTDTTLAADLVPGATTVSLTSGANFENGNNPWNRQLLIFNYTNGLGYTFPAYTYSRKSSYNHANYATNGAWAAGGVSGNTITLSEAWPASLGTIPAGTAVSNGSAGNAFKYIAASGVQIPNTWTNYKGTIGGWDANGSNNDNLFPYGTAFVRLVFILNYTVTGNVTNLSSLWFSELTANNVEPAAAAQQGVVSLANQQLGAGDKYFASKVGIGTTSPASRLDIGAGAITMAEMTAPAAPSANGVVIYAEDNGSGKTRLMALFPSGAAKQIEIET